MAAVASFEEHLPALTRFATNLTRNGDRANDLVQDTVMRLLTRDPEAAHIDNIKSFMMSTLRNLFVDSTRRGKWFAADVDVDDLETASNDAPQDLQLATKEVIAEIGKLPEEMARTLTAHVIDGKSYTEIAREFGVPIGTVTSRINRARSNLKNVIGLSQNELLH